jgi:hypothetical protein
MRMTRKRSVASTAFGAASLLLILAVTGPAAAQTTACPKGLKSQAVAEMIFGRNIGEIVGGVSEEEWLRFLDEVVTPRFSDGLTVVDAYGQWWNPPEGRVEREPSKILLVVLRDEALQRPRLAEIAALYKRRFSQQSVIVMLRRACVTF